MSLGNVEVRILIFQNDILMILLFVLCSSIITDFKKSEFDEFGDKKTRLNHLLFMDDLKLLAKSHDHW